VLNDVKGCSDFLRQMELQASLPAEIVIVDAGSTDGTWEYIKNYVSPNSLSIRVAQEPGCNIARGRNLAIINSAYDIIASTDIGCIWEPEWLAELVAPLFADEDCQAVMGSWCVRWEDQKTPWAKVDPLLHNSLEFKATPNSHASSRAIAYRKSLWEKIGGYPEDLTLAGDDLVFVLLLHCITDKVKAAPIPRCIWLRPQRFLLLLKEAKRNFYGGAEAGIWLHYFILVGGRILVEWLIFVGLILAFLLKSPKATVLNFVAFVFLLSILRAITWVKLWLSINKRGRRLNIAHLIVLDCATRLWALLGYIEGFFHGAKHCQECRKRLRAVGIGWW
jgi:glycosyltransferase involved in cell wall biosynthesis